MRIQRAKLTPANTTAATLYQVGTKAAGQWDIGPTGCGVVRVVNTSAAAVTFRLFHHRQGTTYDTTTALYYDVSIPANTSRTYPVAALVAPGESIGVRTGTANNLTFTYEAPNGVRV